MSFMRKFVPYFVLHLNKYKLHPREILSFIKNLKWRKGKKERLDIKSSSRVPPGSSVRFVFSPPDLAHYNTCCWTKSKGAEAGQVSLNIPVTLPLSHVRSWMWGQLGQLNRCTLLGVPLGYAQSRHSVEVSKLLGFFPPCSHWATSVLSSLGEWGWMASHCLHLSNLRRGCSFCGTFSEPGLTFYWIGWKLSPPLTKFLKRMGLEWPLWFSLGGSSYVGTVWCQGPLFQHIFPLPDGFSLSTNDFFVVYVLGAIFGSFHFIYPFGFK